MKRAIVATFAALLLLTTPVAGAATVLKEDRNAPQITGDEVMWGATIAYDFNDHKDRRYVHHHCSEVYVFYPDGSRLEGPILQLENLVSGEPVTLNAWPSTSWAICSPHVIDSRTGGVAQTDLWYLVPPAP